MGRPQLVAVALPLSVGLYDAVGTIAIVSESRCASHCYAGLLQFPFAPTLTPIYAVGVGDENRDPSVAVVVVAYAVVLALLVAWWWWVGGQIARRLRAADPPKRLAWARALVMYVAASALTFAVKYPVFGLAEFVGLWAAVPLELAVWAAVLRVLGRSAETRRTPG